MSESLVITFTDGRVEKFRNVVLVGGLEPPTVQQTAYEELLDYFHGVTKIVYDKGESNAVVNGDKVKSVHFLIE